MQFKKIGGSFDLQLYQNFPFLFFTRRKLHPPDIHVTCLFATQAEDKHKYEYSIKKYNTTKKPTVPDRQDEREQILI